MTIERGMTSLKYYYDLNCEVDKYTYSFGPCWEPVIAQCKLCIHIILFINVCNLIQNLNYFI